MSKVPHWIPEGQRNTAGGQTVGFKHLHCEPKGASDYCRHCGMDLGSETGEPNVCGTLERIRLSLIPNSEIAAFGCDIEAVCIEFGEKNPERCEKWCHRPECAFSLKDQPE